jgi:predicted transcriptional regulator YdeE
VQNQQTVHLSKKPLFMHKLIKPAIVVLIATGALAAVKFPQSKNEKISSGDTIAPQAIASTEPANKKISNRKIQVAILLDVSNSMDGLIEQAKAQLWNMVSVMGRAQCDNATPQIEIALYEYGRPTNPTREGYVKQINSFTNDLDQVSKNLFSLVTNGGDEYCGHVMYSSLNQLKWDTAANNYKVIFIAGNEDFYQGDISYTKACTEAKQKGVIVNTIYCGDRMQGIREHWNMGSECGNGSFTNINQDAKLEDIATPYDSTLFSLNEQLNSTYIGYGSMGAENYSKQKEVDKLNYSMNKSVAAKRISVKGKKSLYKNENWDLVDADANDNTIVNKIDLKTLPDSLQTKSREELKQFIGVKSKERNAIQQEIETTNIKRETWIIAEKAKASSKTVASTLETEIEKIIKAQAKRFDMIIQ